MRGETNITSVLMGGRGRRRNPNDKWFRSCTLLQER